MIETRALPLLLLIAFGSLAAVPAGAEAFLPVHLAGIRVHDLNPLSRTLLADAAHDAGLDDLRVKDQVIRSKSSFGHGYRVTLRDIHIHLPFGPANGIATSFAPGGIVALEAAFPSAVITARMVIDMYGPLLHDSVDADLVAHGAFGSGKLGFSASDGQLLPQGPTFEGAQVANVQISNAGALGKVLDTFFKAFGFCSDSDCSLDQFATETANQFLDQFVASDAFQKPIRRALVRALADQKPIEFAPGLGMKGRVGVAAFTTQNTSAIVTLGAELGATGEAAECAARLEPYLATTTPPAPNWDFSPRDDIEALIPKSVLEHAFYLAARIGVLCVRTSKHIPFGKLDLGVFPIGKAEIATAGGKEITLDFKLGFDVRAYHAFPKVRSSGLEASLRLRFETSAQEGGALVARLLDASVTEIQGKLTVMGIPISKRLVRNKIQSEVKKQALARMSELKLLTKIIPIRDGIGIELTEGLDMKKEWAAASFRFKMAD
jgi:hypothetical protein